MPTLFRPKRTTKKQVEEQKRFIRRIETALAGMAISGEGVYVTWDPGPLDTQDRQLLRSSDWSVWTPFGPLRVCVYGDWVAASFELWEQYGKFSGYGQKWNHHYPGIDPETAAADFLTRLDRLLKMPAPAPLEEIATAMIRQRKEQHERNRQLTEWFNKQESKAWTPISPPVP